MTKKENLLWLGEFMLLRPLWLFEMVNRRMGKEAEMNMIYLRLLKAFDKGHHKRLLRKFSNHKVRGKFLSVIKCWLIGRKQGVGINSPFSV